jgi:hypothetical protein
VLPQGEKVDACFTEISFEIILVLPSEVFGDLEKLEIFHVQKFEILMNP